MGKIGKNKLDNLVQSLIPPLLVLLLTVSIIELFYDVSKYALLIDIFDIVIIIIFAIDLYYRWFETPHIIPYIRKHILDIIATIPFNLIFLGVDYLVFTRAFRGVRILTRISRFARYGRLVRLLRLGARAPRFLRIRKHLKKGKISKVQPHEKQMEGVLSFKVILLITINSIMGTGIFFLVAAGAKYAGPASLLAWAILSIIAVYIAMCFGELTSMFPKAGGVYEFSKQTYGRFWSFVIGWTTAIGGSVTISMLLLGALQYIIPVEYASWYIPVAIVLIIVFNYIAFRGVQTSTYILVSFALITIGTVLAITFPGIIKFNPSLLRPFFVFPAMNIALSIFFIAETFFGWESAIFLAAETKNPTVVMPKALVYGTCIIAGFAILLALTSLGVVPWQEFGESAAPLRDLGGAHFGVVGSYLFTILVFISIIGAVACWVVTAPRLLMSMAEDKLFFVQFAKIHPKHKSPYVSILFQAVIITVLVVVGAGSYETLLHMLIPLILLIYSAVLLSVVILRYKKPLIKRPYKVIFGNFGPLVAIAFMIFLLIMFIKETHGALDILRVSGSLVAFGIPAYFFIEIFYDQKYVTMRHDWMARFSHHYQKLPLPKRVFNHVIDLIGPFNKKSVVMDFDCKVGQFTRTFLEKEPCKQIIAVDESKEELKIFKKNIPDKKRVKIVYRKSWNLPKARTKVDALFSFNSLGHVDDLPKFVKSLKSILKKKGKFCFYIKHSMVNVTPNAVLVEDQKAVEKLFRKEKLKVKYKKLRHFLKEEIYISGSK